MLQELDHERPQRGGVADREREHHRAVGPALAVDAGTVAGPAGLVGVHQHPSRDRLPRAELPRPQGAGIGPLPYRVHRRAPLLDLAGYPVHAEQALRGLVHVPAHQVPVAAVERQAPGFDAPLGIPVQQRHRPASDGGPHQLRQGLVEGQLAHRLDRLGAATGRRGAEPGEARARAALEAYQVRGQMQHRQFVGFETQVTAGVLRGRDAVALHRRIEPVEGRDLDGHADRPQVGLVAFERAPESGLVLRVGTGHALTQLVRAERVRCVEQRGGEVQEPFELVHGTGA